MENKRKFRPNLGVKLMDQVRQVLRYHHYSYRTEKTYCDWIVLYIKYFGSKKHPRDMGKIEIGVEPNSEYSVDLLSPLLGHAPGCEHRERHPGTHAPLCRVWPQPALAPYQKWANEMLDHPTLPGALKVNIVSQRLFQLTQGRRILVHREES